MSTIRVIFSIFSVFGSLLSVVSQAQLSDSCKSLSFQIQSLKTLGHSQEVLNLKNDDGEADISFPVSGPKGAGQVHVQGTKTNGVWRYDEISITLENEGKTIDLTDEPLAIQP